MATHPGEKDAPTTKAFTSVAALMAAHLDLVHRVDELEGEESSASLQDLILMRRQMRSFQRRAAATGTVIDSPPDREMAQSILDFWCIREGYIMHLADQLRVEAQRETVTEAVDASGSALADAAAAEVERAQRRHRRPPILPEPHKLMPFDEESAPHLADDLCPFVGLSAFDEKHAGRHLFYGREAAVSDMASMIASHRLLVVSAPSGGGKSSLVMAGLVPALRAGAAPGSDDWVYWSAVQPGVDPITSLLLAVRPKDRDEVPWVAAHKQSLAQNPASLPEIIAQASPRAAPSLLIVDQAEELVSMTSDEAARDAFAAALVALVTVPEPASRVVLVVREDFVERLLAIPALARLPEAARPHYRPKPLTSAELHSAIVGPAQIVGLSFEPGIVEDLVREVVNEPAALPLLQFTLTQLWARRRRNKITRSAFAEVGGPNQAVGRLAEQAYEKLGSYENRQAAREIFLALVVPSVGNEYVRRRVRREALHVLLDPSRIDHVLKAFVAAGLIRVTLGVSPDDDRFEVMHEALLRNWPRLGKWLAESRNTDQRRLFIRNAAQLWIDSGRKEDHLAVGTALMEAREHAAGDPVIAEYVEASSEADLEKQRRAQRSLQKTRWVAAGFATLALFEVISLAKLYTTLDELQAKNVELSNTYGELEEKNGELRVVSRRNEVTSRFLAQNWCASRGTGTQECETHAVERGRYYADTALNNPGATQRQLGNGSVGSE